MEAEDCGLALLGGRHRGETEAHKQKAVGLVMGPWE